MYFYVYEVLNKMNGSIYVGCHKTSNLDDNYMGSGVLIKRAISKYGADFFQKTILHLCETQEEMFERESEIVTADFVGRNDTYNLKLGGDGGFDHINTSTSIRHQRDSTISRMMCEPGPYRDIVIANLERIRKPNNDNFQEGRRKSKRFTGKSHSETSKSLISSKKKGTGMREANSNFGSFWISNGVENRKIKLSEDIPQGWYRGRKI